MSILTACQSAAIRLLRRKPPQFFSSTEPFEMEICDLVQDVAVEIARAADWQALTKYHETPGDGATIYFDLPTDFDRLPVDQRISSDAWTDYVFSPIRNLNDWTYIQDTLSIGAPGYWIILNNKLGIYPAMPGTEKAKFYYLSNQFATDSTGNTPKDRITADTDKFLLDERLLTLGLMWRYRNQHKLDYAEDLENYQRALAERVGKQKGQRPLFIGTPRVRTDVGIAFPGRIIG